MEKLTAKKVNDVFLSCLYKDGETIKEFIPVEGITMNVGFNPEKIKEYTSTIRELLDELPKTFNEGITFLNMCMTKDGEQWGDHPNMQELMLLGIATGMLIYPLPKEMWGILPGSVPYVQRVSEDKIQPLAAVPYEK